MAGNSREAGIDYKFVLRGRQHETVVNDLYVSSAAASEGFCFKPPYQMADHGSTMNGINWNDGYIDYRELHTVPNKTVAGFAHLYAYGVSKCTFLAGLKGRPFHNLEDVNCPSPDTFNHDRWYTLPCHKCHKFAGSTKTTHFLYDLLMYYLQKKISSKALPT